MTSIRSATLFRLSVRRIDASSITSANTALSDYRRSLVATTTSVIGLA